jgi:site-specific recombinase XerD
MNKQKATAKQLTLRPVTLPRRALTSAEFSQLADVPPETEWFANIDNPHTRRAYRNDLKEFMTFTGIRTPIELRLITRAHVIAWCKDLDRRRLAPGSIRRKLSALSSLYEFLTDQNAVPVNPVKGVKRPKVDSYEGKTPAIADKEARQLMSLPNERTLKGLRDRALLATLLYHGLRREELCRLKVKDVHPRRGVPHLRVHGKGDKTRYIPLHAGTQELLNDYLDEARHAADTEGALFDPSATTVPANSTTPSPLTVSTNSSAVMLALWDSRSAPMRCAPPPPPMRLTTTPTLPKSKNGWGTPTLQQPGFMIGAR